MIAPVVVVAASDLGYPRERDDGQSPGHRHGSPVILIPVCAL